MAGCVVCSRSKSVCDCCENAYTSIDHALDCIGQRKDETSTADKRLLLFAFVPEDTKKYQELGWNILENQELIEIAKQKYLLIILNSNDLSLLKKEHGEELLSIYVKDDSDLIYIITNQVLYPFGSWTKEDSKDRIIDILQIGNGP